MRYYKPGMMAHQSGVYQAVHGSSHRLEHEVTISANTIFPLCRRCREDVRFKLLQPVKQAEQGWAPFGVIFEPYGTMFGSRPKPHAA